MSDQKAASLSGIEAPIKKLPSCLSKADRRIYRIEKRLDHLVDHCPGEARSSHQALVGRPYVCTEIFGVCPWRGRKECSTAGSIEVDLVAQNGFGQSEPFKITADGTIFRREVILIGKAEA